MNKEMTLIEIAENMAHYVVSDKKLDDCATHRSLLIIAAEGDLVYAECATNCEPKLIAALATQYIRSKQFRSLIKRMVTAAELTPEFREALQRNQDQDQERSESQNQERSESQNQERRQP